MAGKACIDLGFAELCEDKRRLQSRFFPSKLGGPPAWLSFHHLPDFEALRCENCLKTCKFLLQIYSPGDDDVVHDHGGGHGDTNDDDHHDNHDDVNDDNSISQEEGDATDFETFHRTLYIFICVENLCSKRVVKCFRSQLSRHNNFYAWDPPNEQFMDDEKSHSKASMHCNMCAVCFAAATKSCSQCKSSFYCCKDHQSLHWKNGHKEGCLAGRMKGYRLVVI